MNQTAIAKATPIQPSSPMLNKFISRARNPFIFKLYLLAKLPMAFIARLQIESLDPKQAKVSVPHGWINQNPFQSTYFAVLSMAAEMSTGILGTMAIANAETPISMLVVDTHSSFSKKATDLTTFHCENGDLFFKAVEQTLKTGEAVTVTAQTVGRNKAGVEVARATYTWSIKKKEVKLLE